MINFNRKPDLVHMDRDRLAQLQKLAEKMRRPRSQLYREAVEDYLRKHGVIEQAVKRSARRKEAVA
jgi:predicted transcriptional regulator